MYDSRRMYPIGMALQSDAISVHANDVGMVDEVCQATFKCAYGDELTHLLLFLVTGLLTAFIVAAIIHLRDARSAVSEEQSRTAAEHDAFAAFSRRIASLDPVAPAIQSTTGQTGPTVTLATESQPPDNTLATITEAYKETVMAVSHYEEDYDETLAENMRAEFGDEVASAIVNGSQFTPQLKEALLHGSRDAQERRRELMTGLQREHEDIKEAYQLFTDLDADLESINDQSLADRSFTDLMADWDRLGAIEERCREALTQRQQHIREWSMSGPRSNDAPTLHEYLYQPLDVTYPILAEGTALVDRIQTIRSRVLIGLTRRA